MSVRRCPSQFVPLDSLQLADSLLSAGSSELRRATTSSRRRSEIRRGRRAPTRADQRATRTRISPRSRQRATNPASSYGHLDDRSRSSSSQILVVRTDLAMTKGKIAAQCGHATLACYESLMRSNPKVRPPAPLASTDDGISSFSTGSGQVRPRLRSSATRRRTCSSSRRRRNRWVSALDPFRMRTSAPCPSVL